MPSIRCRKGWLALILILMAAAAAFPQERLSAAEYSRLIRDLSEEGGYFFSDNFTSNEDSYLTVVDKLKELGVSGGAYIGVGPEQNFTYIAKIRPRIAFIVDIRRQAVIQQLMYKAIFHLAKHRIEFLSYLFSKPLTPRAPSANASIQELVGYFSSAPSDIAAFDRNLDLIQKTIEEHFRLGLSAHD